MKVRDLISDEKTGRTSSTKFWANVANLVMTYIMVKQAETVGWELLAAYGGIVGGSQIATYFIKLRYRNDRDSPPPEK